MVSTEPAPMRNDMPQTKSAFDTIFAANLKHREVMKQRFDIDIDELAENCWQACDAGSRESVLNQHKELTKAWEEHKALVEGLLRHIGEGHLDHVPAKGKNPKISS